jgi:hypothetical protein
MAFDVVTAKQGKPHVTADQQALMQAGMLGKGRYALDALNNLACTMTDSNTLTVDTGGLMVDGRWVVNEAQTSFAIANGSQAQFRKDLAVLEITVDPSTGVTSLEEKVLQGATAATEAAAADPTYEPGDLYTGLTAVVPIARITLDGLTPTCGALLPSVADLKTISEQTKKLGDSVSRTPLSVANVKSGFAIKAWKTQLGVQIDVTGSSNTLIQSGEEWGYEIARIPAAASLTLCGLVGMMWTEGANNNDLMWFHMYGSSLRVDFKSKTKDWPKTIHCDGIMAYS